MPVIDETQLKEKYAWDVIYNQKLRNTIIGALRKELGLTLTLSKRNVEVLVVESR